MVEPASLFALASAGIVALLIISTALLRGWSGWLEVKRLELEARSRSGQASAPPRIEIADLKERVQKLEAIASGTE